MTWWVWKRKIIAAAEAAEAVSEKGCNRGVLLGLKRVWPPADGCGHGRTEAEDDRGAVAGEGAGTAGATEGEITGGCDEESIVEREERNCFSLFRALIPSWE